jgi:tetratricopeptide (TPR) repeat protein
MLAAAFVIIKNGPRIIVRGKASRMKLNKFPVIVGFLVCFAHAGLAQTDPIPSPASPPRATPEPKFSTQIAKNVETIGSTEVPRDRREQAYTKLLEGQRYAWSAARLRSQVGVASTLKLARQAFQKAVELDPTLAEGYTALAEIAANTPPGDVEEAISLATIATKIDLNNFGGHRILARLYTFKSRLAGGVYDPVLGDTAISEWKHIARLDPRNAEAWAFLSEFYDKTNKSDERIDALKKWLGSASPIETQFYRLIFGGRENLSPESASLKLGPALLKAGRTREAIETLSLVVSDDPDNYTAVDLLREALESARGETAAIVIESLQQAVFANPGNATLINMLADVYVRAGKFDDAAKLLGDSSARLRANDLASAAALQSSLGDIYVRADRFTEAVAAYETAMKYRWLDTAETLSDDEREFAMQVFEKLIRVLKATNKPNEAKAVIERARKLLGKDDLFADRQLISLYRETGKRAEALAAVRAVRARFPEDYGFIRLEATLLTESGKVDEAVAIVKKLIQTKPAGSPITSSPSPDGATSISVPVPAHDEFSNYLFISNLYSEAGRGKEAAAAANQAYLVAKGTERKQIAKLTLATAQQMSGDFKGAEATLREILNESPGNPIALNNLGYFLLERDERIDEALGLIQQAIKVDPTNPSYLDSLGWAYFKKGNLDEAEKQLKEALRMDSSSGTIQEHLGDVYAKQGKADLAKSAWGKALDLVSDTADIKRLNEKLGTKGAR